MSAFLCSAAHLSALIDYSRQHKGHAVSLYALIPSNEPKRKTDEQMTFEVLLFENLKSLEARYPNDPPNTAHWSAQPFTYRYTRGGKHWTAVEILSLANSYEYQSCEHDGWETSEAKKWIDGLRHHAIHDLPGYDAAPWAID